MELQNDIKKVVSEQGCESLRSITFANILADTSREYNDSPALKRILREILISGVGGKLLDLADESKQVRDVKSKTLACEFSAKNGFREDAVAYVFDCLRFALGWIDSVSEISEDSDQADKTSIPDSSEKEQLDLNKMLNSLKIDYVNSLASFYVYPVKSFFSTKQGYFSSENAGQLLLMEQKVAVLAEALNLDLSQWCADQKEKFEQSNRIPEGEIRHQFMTRIAMPVCVGVLACGGLFYHNAAARAKEKFTLTLVAADSTLATGDYNRAFVEYVAAKNGFDGILSSSDALNEANVKVAGLLTKNEEGLIAEGKYAEAIDWLNDLKNTDALDREVISLIDNHIASLNERGKSEAAAGFPKLVELISRNKGVLPPEGRDLLKRLLVMSPNDYWLTILAAKEF